LGNDFGKTATFENWRKIKELRISQTVKHGKVLFKGYINFLSARLTPLPDTRTLLYDMLWLGFQREFSTLSCRHASGPPDRSPDDLRTKSSVRNLGEYLDIGSMLVASEKISSGRNILLQSVEHAWYVDA
jgi:hypothetical protein